MNEYWKAAKASKKWKPIVFDSVIRSKLLYALETTELTRSLMNNIEAFQIRGLRKILKIKHPYWDRTATNERVLETATEEAYRKGTVKSKLKNAKFPNPRALLLSSSRRERKSLFDINELIGSNNRLAEALPGTQSRVFGFGVYIHKTPEKIYGSAHLSLGGWTSITLHVKLPNLLRVAQILLLKNLLRHRLSRAQHNLTIQHEQRLRSNGGA